VDGASIARLVLRLAHAIAAVTWLGGGMYYALALRPQLAGAGDEAKALAARAQRAFVRWAFWATVVLIVTGIALMYDRLNAGGGTVVYVIILAVKVIAAAGAFFLTGIFTERRTKIRAITSAGRGRASVERHQRRIERAWMLVGLGMVAFVLGIALSSIYPTGVGH